MPRDRSTAPHPSTLRGRRRPTRGGTKVAFGHVPKPRTGSLTTHPGDSGAGPIPMQGPLTAKRPACIPRLLARNPGEHSDTGRHGSELDSDATLLAEAGVHSTEPASATDIPAASRARTSRRRDIASFLRFVACGGGTGVAAAVTLSATPEAVPMPLANALVTVLATLLTNELHSRVTFRRGRASRRVHAQSTGTAVASYLFTTSAMLALAAASDRPPALVEQGAYLVASSLAGVGRYAMLRFFVFKTAKKTGEDATAVQSQSRSRANHVRRRTDP